MTITKALFELCSSWLHEFYYSILIFIEPSLWRGFTSSDLSIIWNMIKSNNNDIQSVNLYRGHSMQGTSHPSLSYLINYHQPGYILSDIVLPVVQCHKTCVPYLSPGNSIQCSLSSFWKEICSSASSYELIYMTLANKIPDCFSQVGSRGSELAGRCHRRESTGF